MPNNYTRKTDRGTASVEIYDLAFEEVKLKGKSLRDAATSYNLNYMSLSRYIRKKEAYQENPKGKAPSMDYSMPTIFTEEEENILSDYLLTCAASNYGLTRNETRVIAYKLAKKYNKKMPKSWQKNEEAGEVWLNLFMQRHQNLSLRLPQATSTKDEIAAIEANRKSNNVKKRVLSEEKKKPKKVKKNRTSDEEETENNYFCLICLEAYADSRSNEQWVQCLECKGWAHVH